MHGEIEEKIEAQFKAIETGLVAIDEEKDADRADEKLKGVSAMIIEAKGMIKDWEKEAVADGVPSDAVAAKKKELGTSFNTYLALRKQTQMRIQGMRAQSTVRAAVAGAAVAAAGVVGEMAREAGEVFGVGGEYRRIKPGALQEQDQQELMETGRDALDETDKSLARSKQVISDTKAVGLAVGQRLQEQSEQIRQVTDNVENISQTLKKASGLVRDIGRQIMGDKCIQCFMTLVAIGVAAMVICNIMGIKIDLRADPQTQAAARSDAPPRRFLLDA